MAKQASKVSILSPEDETWELFEVGANDEVVRLAENNPGNHFIQHLAILAQYEIHGKVTISSSVGISKLSGIVEGLFCFLKGNSKEAASHISLYFQGNNANICYSIIQLSIKIFYASENYSDIKKIIELYKKKYDSFSFIKEELNVAYQLRKYEDVVLLYKANSRHLNDPDIHKLIGMSLLFLNRPKEANLILESIPGKLELPSFEEKKKSYDSIFSKIALLEKRSNELSLKELEDMGFAYLFNGEYEKAERLFSNLTLKLKSELCTV